MSVTITTHDFKVGDKVTVGLAKFPGVWTVKNLGPVNATLTPADGGRGLRAPYYLLTAVTDDPGAIPVVEPPTTTLFSEGEIVTVPGSKWTGLYVVIKDAGAERINLAKLGGDNGRYLRITRGAVSKVDPADVLK